MLQILVQVVLLFLFGLINFLKLAQFLIEVLLSSLQLFVLLLDQVLLI